MSEPTTPSGKRYAATGATRALDFILAIEAEARQQGAAEVRAAIADLIGPGDWEAELTAMQAVAAQQGAKAERERLRVEVEGLDTFSQDWSGRDVMVLRRDVLAALSDAPAAESTERPVMTDDCPDTCSRWPGCGHTEADFR